MTDVDVSIDLPTYPQSALEEAADVNREANDKQELITQLATYADIMDRHDLDGNELPEFIAATIVYESGIHEVVDTVIDHYERVWERGS